MKKPVILLILLAALVGFAMLYEKGLSKRVNSARLAGADLREFVLPDLPADQIRRIRIREGDKQVGLALSDNRWSVTERSGYAASFDKIERAVKLLAEMKIKGKQEVSGGGLSEVKLLAPGDGASDRTGLQVELMNGKEEVVASIIAGENTTTSGGASAASGNMFGGPGEMRYVRVPDGRDKDTVWFVEDSFYELSPDPKEWVDKGFINVQKVKSAELTMPVATDSWKAERKDENAAFAFVNAAQGDELDTAKADGLASVLSSALFNDLLPKDKATADVMKDAVKAKLVTFDGFTYDLEMLQKKEAGSEMTSKCFLTVKVSADIAKERKAAADEKPEDKTAKDAEFAATKKSLEEKLAKEKGFEGWVYEVSDYTVNALLKKRSEVLREKTPPAPAPGATPPGFPGVPAIPGLPPTPLAPPAGAPPAAAPAPPVKPPVSVTTPPISVDGAKPADAKPAGKPADAKPAEPRKSGQ